MYLQMLPVILNSKKTQVITWLDVEYFGKARLMT